MAPVPVYKLISGANLQIFCVCCKTTHVVRCKVSFSGRHLQRLQSLPKSLERAVNRPWVLDIRRGSVPSGE